MAPQAKRTPLEWFREAARCYVEGHQACAWCGGRHRVFKSQREGRLGYYCHTCDFYVCLENATEQCFMVPGDGVPSSGTAALLTS